LSAVVPFVPLPGPKNAWAIVCPAGCDTELIILPEYAGAWVECPTCGFRFLGPHPAQPQLVAKARAAAAQAAAKEKRMAGALAAMAQPSPEPPGSASPAPKVPPAAACPPRPGRRAEKQPPPQDLAPEQSRAQAAREVLEKARCAAAPASPAPKSRRQIIADVKATTKRALPTKAQPAGAAKAIPGPARRPSRPESPPAAAPPASKEKTPDQELTPEESKALGALEVLAKANGGPAGARKPRSAALPVAEPVRAELAPEESRALDALAMLAMTNQTASAASPAAPAATSKKAAGRRARQRLDLEPKAPVRAVAGRRPARARPVEDSTGRVAAGAPGAASGLARLPAGGQAGRGDLILTWVVSLVIAAGIIVAAFACGLPDLALGSVVFIGLAVLRTWVAFRSPKEDLPL
jgi:hypothetical protein